MTPIERTIFIIDAISLLFIFFGRTLTNLVMYLIFLVFIYEKYLKDRDEEEEEEVEGLFAFSHQNKNEGE